MGCSSCGKRALSNLVKAAKSQPDKVRWFKDGVTGIAKCLGHKTTHSDEQISHNREVCRNCEFSTKNSQGKLTMSSQCMAPDPNNNNAPCGCFIICKTQNDQCPLGKWTQLTIKNNE